MTEATKSATPLLADRRGATAVVRRFGKICPKLPLGGGAKQIVSVCFSAAQLGEFSQHGVSGNHTVSAQVLGGIKGLIRLPEKPAGASIVAGDVRRHADA